MEKKWKYRKKIVIDEQSNVAFYTVRTKLRRILAGVEVCASFITHFLHYIKKHNEREKNGVAKWFGSVRINIHDAQENFRNIQILGVWIKQVDWKSLQSDSKIVIGHDLK